MTILTGSFTTFYQVMMGDVPFFVLLIATSGLILAVFVALFFKRKRLKIDENLALLT